MQTMKDTMVFILMETLLSCLVVEEEELLSYVSLYQGDLAEDPNPHNPVLEVKVNE